MYATPLDGAAAKFSRELSLKMNPLLANTFKENNVRA
jgi:hypothetical protein